jgi:hypothetical protein
VEGEGEDDKDGGEEPVTVPPPSSSIIAFALSSSLLLFSVGQPQNFMKRNQRKNELHANTPQASRSGE